MVSHNGVTGLLGLAKKAGATASGTEGVRGLVRSGRSRLVLLACDCSQNAAKRVENCCSSYHAALIHTGLTMQELGAAVGSAPCSAVAVSDKGLADAIKDKGAAIWQ